ncbi:MAG TPA: trypsin-like peptidase domain-containing protein, partial [Nitrospiria bacterium]|nr:trypsin-like peptidase domain-containing protein [Nitrospiria bacterium]
MTLASSFHAASWGLYPTMRLPERTCSFSVEDGGGKDINNPVRALMLSFFLGLLAGTSFAQEKVVQTFDGATDLTTPAFQVQDKWEVRWNSPEVISMTILSPDGAVVAGASASSKGSLYLPKGGNFHLQISGSTEKDAAQWHVSVVEIDSTAAGAKETNDVADYVPPQIISAPVSTNITSTPVAPSTATTSLAPGGSTPPVAGALTEDQAHAVVVIKGDVGEGTGFLIKTADGPAVVTNLHVISANPNVKILTTTGAQIKTLSLKGASDRDLAMFMIQDDHYTYLDLATDIKDTVQTDDEVITPGNSEGGEVVLNTKGKVLGIGPERI